MRLEAGLRLRIGAGVVAACLLGIGAVVVLRGSDGSGRPLGAGETVSDDANGLPVAVGPDGEVIEPKIGDPPELETDAPSPEDVEAMLAERTERATAAASEPAKATPGEPGAVSEAEPGSLLVTFEPGTSDADVAAALDAAGVDGQRIADSDVVRVDLADADAGEVTTALEARDAVAAAEPNFVRRATKVPNDPQTAAQRQAAFDRVNIGPAWDVADTAAKATVAVIDSGADLDHPDLVPNLVAGYDFVNGDTQPMDDNGHGTMVSGIIGAATNNGVGVAGIAWNAKVMPLKALDAEGSGFDSNIVGAIYRAISLNVDVINLSLGGPDAGSGLQTAIDDALANDIVVIAAAGNSGAAAPSFPAAFPGVVSVGATDAAGHVAYFSTHGGWVTLAAPGIDVVSTALAPGTTAAVDKRSGTSFSSPIVAGVAALLREEHPTWSSDQIVSQLIRTATDAGPAGVDDAYGWGIVNAAAALGVGAIGPVSQPNLAGDAGNVGGSARSITPGTTATESLGYESDEDWFSFTVASPGGATITVTPPPMQLVGTRARELDPVVEIYGPTGGLVASADDGFTGEPEQATFNTTAGLHRIRVRNYHAPAGPSPYSVRVDLGAAHEISSLAAPEAIGGFSKTTTEPIVADVTDDGRDDVVVGGTVAGVEGNYVLAQQPDGSYTQFAQLTTHAPRADLAVVDLDGDGDRDIAFSTSSGLEVSWNTDSGLDAPVELPGTAGANTLSAVQLDDTPAVELLDTRAVTLGWIQVLRWTGTDVSAQPLPLSFDGTVDFLRTGDVTGDGRVDIVAGDFNKVTVFAQQADGSWTPRPVTTEAPGTRWYRDLAIGDVSGDGRPDLVLVAGEGPQPQPHLLMTYVQAPDGSFDVPFVVPTGPDPGGVLTADMTGDAEADALVLHTSTYSPFAAAVGFHPQANVGRPSYAESTPTTLPPGTSTRSLTFAAGQLSPDGRTDVVVAHDTAGVLLLRQQTSTAPTPATPSPWVEATSPAPHATAVSTSASPSVTFGTSVAPGSVAYGDTVMLWNARTGWGIDATATLSGRTLTVNPVPALTPGTPYLLQIGGITDTADNPVYEQYAFTTATAPAPTYSVNATYSPFGVDITGDGFDEVVWYTPSTALDPLWSFDADGRFDAGAFDIQGTFVPVVGDFDDNGFEDIFWYSPGSGLDLMWYWGINGSGQIDIVATANYVVNGTYQPVAGDFDGNGYDDIFWYAAGAGAESIWKFRAGGYTPSAQPAVNGTGYRLAAGDFNRDGYADIFWHLPGAGAESLWKGGPTAFARGGTTNVSGSYSLRAGDFTGDGFDDLYWWKAGTASLWKGSAGTFPAQVAPAVAGTARPVAGDFTGDGYDDLIAYVPGTTSDKLLPGKPTGL